RGAGIGYRDGRTLALGPDNGIEVDRAKRRDASLGPEGGVDVVDDLDALRKPLPRLPEEFGLGLSLEFRLQEVGIEVCDVICVVDVVPHDVQIERDYPVGLLEGGGPFPDLLFEDTAVPDDLLL